MNEWLALTMLALVFAFATLIRVLLGPVATEPASSRDTTPWWPSYTTALDQAVQRQLLLQLAVPPTSLQEIELPPSHPVPVDRQTDPVLGWRFWSLRQGFSESGHTTMWLLTSMNDTVWRPRVAMRATCEAGRLVPFQAVPPNPFHDAPTQQCTCGVYAFRPESFINGIWQAPLGCVVGEIKGWGRVMEHQLGWRAASAYPSSIFLVLRLVLQRRALDASGLGRVRVAIGHCGGECSHLLDEDGSSRGAGAGSGYSDGDM